MPKILANSNRSRCWNDHTAIHSSGRALLRRPETKAIDVLGLLQLLTEPIFFDEVRLNGFRPAGDLAIQSPKAALLEVEGREAGLPGAQPSN